jgi:hypothetical protein
MTAKSRYVICVRADEVEDLEVRKVYRVLPDESAAVREHLRVVDESGEDYLYPAAWFVFIEIPEDAEPALTGASLGATPRGR